MSGIIGKHGHHVQRTLGGGGTFWGTSQAGLMYPSWPRKIVCWGDNVRTPRNGSSDASGCFPLELPHRLLA